MRGSQRAIAVDGTHVALLHTRVLADRGEVMPPKTTYFEPTPYAGIFVRSQALAQVGQTTAGGPPGEEMDREPRNGPAATSLNPSTAPVRAAPPLESQELCASLQ